jgi:hypothetical protein
MLHNAFPAAKASFKNSTGPEEAIRAYGALYLSEEVQTVEGYISILEVDLVVYGNILLKFLTKVDRRTFRNSKNP